MKRGRWLRSLFGSLMLAFGSVIFIGLVFSTVLYSTVLRSVVVQEMASAAEADAHSIAVWAGVHGEAGELRTSLTPAFAWKARVEQDRLWLVDTSGTVVLDTGRAGSEVQQKPAYPWIDEVLQGETLSRQVSDGTSDAAIIAGHPVLQGDKVVGAVFLFIGPERISAELKGVRFMIEIAAVLAGLLGLAWAFWLSRSFARPIEEMVRFASELGGGRFSAQLRPSRVRELDHLAWALAGAAARLQASFDAVVEEKQRIQSLIQELADGVVAVDEHGHILLANEAAAEILGMEMPPPGRSLAEAGLPQPLAEGLRQCANPAEPRPVRIQLEHGGAELLARIWPVVTETGPGGAVALLEDITSDAQLQRMRESFVANVSHELRGPLAALSAGVEAMHDGLIADDARPRYLAAMLSEIGRLHRLVDDLLELSRLDAGLVEIPLEPLDLRPLCEGLAEKWEPRAAALGINLTVDTPDLVVVANYDRVEEVLTNFLDNAVRFTAPGGVIRLFAVREGEVVRVGVSDTGTGIAKEHLPHIWDRFYKADPSRTRAQGGGTGMGLALVKQLVERMGGAVSVRSQPGHGSTFQFTLKAGAEKITVMGE